MQSIKIASLVVRVLFGGLFVFSGLNKLLGFLPPPQLPAPGAAFVGAMVATGYLFGLLALVEVIFGALIIAGRFVPLALTVLAPIVVNIALFHLVLAPSVPIALFVVGSELFLAWVYRDAFAGVLKIAPEPAALPAFRGSLPKENPGTVTQG